MRVTLVVLIALLSSASADEVHGSLDLRHLEYSNLRGLGPMRDVEETLRFREAAQVGSEKADMVITTDGDYTPTNVAINGPLSQDDEHTLGVINMRAGTRASFHVSFVKTDTTQELELPELFFSVFDLERPSSFEEDRLEVKGFEAVYLTKKTVLMYSYGEDGGTAFKTSDEAVGQAVKDPTDGLLLSEEQRAHTATFLFRHVKSFDFSVEFPSASQSPEGRIVLFGSAANAPGYTTRLPISYIRSNVADEGGWRHREDWLSDLSKEDDDSDTSSEGGAAEFRQPGPLETTCSCSLDLTHVALNNLGGLGPDTGKGEMIRYEDVCNIDGQRVDLVVENYGDYSSTSPEKNGHSSCGPYGSISIRLGTMVSLKARFLDADTNAAVKVKDFFFTIFDMDLHGAHSEKVTIHGFKDYFTSDGSLIAQEEVMNGGLFTSPGVPFGVQCPPDPLALTDTQANVAVTALFRDTDEFSFSLEVLGAESQGSHTFFFGGTSSLNTDCVGLGLPTTTQTVSTTTTTLSTTTRTSLTTTTETVTITTTSSTTQTLSTTTFTTTFNCTAFQAGSSWTEDSRDFCCDLDPQFCTTTGTTTTETTSTTQTTTETTSTTEPFSCKSGPPEAWHKNKTAYCCEEHKLGCPDTTTTKPQPFNCSDMEPRDWSTEKQAWCCDNHKLGCSLLSANSTHTRQSSTSTAAPYAGCGERVTCELRLNTVKHDNLGGRGPDKIEPPVIRYGDVCFTDEGPLDLVISVDGPYEPFNSLDDGKSAWGPYGAINVQLGTAVNLEATFVEAGTNTPAAVGSVLFSLFGLYQHSPQHREAVTLHSFSSFHLADPSYVEHSAVANGGIFRSTDKGNTLQVVSDPLQCSEDQERTSVSLLFKEISSFAFTLAVEGPQAKGGRDFLFGGRSCITEHCNSKPATTKATTTKPTTRPSTSSTSTSPTQPATTTSTSKGDRYDCHTGDEEAWDHERRDWCCKHKSVACGKLYDCDAGFVNWRFSWSQIKMDYCCAEQKRGCQFSCDVAFNNWKAAWSDRKKEWCCKREQRGCRESEKYDCGLERSDWSLAQQHWCCQNQKKGCEAANGASQGWDPFDCDHELDNWRARWSHPKKQWCCDNFRKGCEGTTPEPFDCAVGFEAWRTGWEPPKKEWCCHNYNRGCADVLRRFEQRKHGPDGRPWNAGTVAAICAMVLPGLVASAVALRHCRGPQRDSRLLFLPGQLRRSYMRVGRGEVLQPFAEQTIHDVFTEHSL